MKNLHLSRYFFLPLVLFSSAFASLPEKSAIVYYGNNISYPIVGIHDYIIVQPEFTNTHTHGFALYKEKIYAYVSVGEIHSDIKEYKNIQDDWILTTNKAWNSKVLDIKNPAYMEYFFKELIEPRRVQGFKNFFFDTLDSYQLVCKTQQERQESEKALVSFINEFHKRYPDSKLIINRGFEIIDQVHSDLEAVLFESYYEGIGGEKLAYQRVSDDARNWLDIHLQKIKSYGLNIIALEYLPEDTHIKSAELIQKIQKKGMIPYIANRELNIYGKSSKNAIKREIFTLIDTDIEEEITSDAHRYGTPVFEYMGYIQKIFHVSKPLPSMSEMDKYQGAVIWLTKTYNNPQALITWIQQLKKIGIKVAIVGSLPVDVQSNYFETLGIKIIPGIKHKNKILYQDSMLSYKMKPSMLASNFTIEAKKSKALLIYKHNDASNTTPAALTEWGGYALEESFIMHNNKENIWVINPFEFFKQALDLPIHSISNQSPQNTKRLLSTHIDRIMNKIEKKCDIFLL
jgi:hypothetical protein